jgi:Protein of unknown function (DUF3224)
MSTLTATFEVESWDEQPFDDAASGEQASKVTSAKVTKRYAGDIEGTSTTEWLMAYNPDETAAFVGIERIRGTVDGKKGTLVVQHVGRFENGAATAVLTVLTGTDELEGASGSGDFRADPKGSVSLDLS